MTVLIFSLIYPNKQLRNFQLVRSIWNQMIQEKGEFFREFYHFGILGSPIIFSNGQESINTMILTSKASFHSLTVFRCKFCHFSKALVKESTASVKYFSPWFHFASGFGFFILFFHIYQARRALRALKGIVLLQALIRGHSVRRQTTETLQCMQALVKAQARVRARQVRVALENQVVRKKNPEQDDHENHVREVEVGNIVSKSLCCQMSHLFHIFALFP